MKDFNKIYGCLLGGGAGDALGYVVEFIREDIIFGIFGQGGIQEYVLENGKAIISDDTQMTLFTAEGLLLAKDQKDYNDYIQSMHHAYKEWLQTQMFRKNKNPKIWLSGIPELNDRRAPGITCLNALESGEMGTIFEPINNSKGCGGVMRVAPIGLFFSPDEMDWGEIDLRAAQAAAITHGHPLGYIPAAALAHIVNLAMYRPEMSLLEIMEDMIARVPKLFEFNDEKEAKFFANLMRKAVSLATKPEIPVLDAIHQLGEGWVGEEALAIAVYCALRFENDFDAALIASVNHNGDSDSTGAITGNILGAFLGIQAIPSKYIDNLELADVIEKVARRLSEK